MKSVFFVLMVLISVYSRAQEVTGSEVGIEGYVGVSSLGGNYGVGLKYGVQLNKNFVVGPSFRIMKGWSNNNGTNYNYSIYGGGVYAHARYGNMIFGGVELEVLHSPFNFGLYSSSVNHWVPTAFVGGGFSREFIDLIRINAGVFYDVINSVNSPFRPSYKMTKTNSLTGQVSGFIPVIYRINFFIRIGDGKEKEEIIEEEEL